REWIARLRDWFQRDNLDVDLQEELQFHREQLERDARAAGAGAPQAVLEAGRRLGSTLRAREEARDRWSWPWLDHLQRDFRMARRGLARTPAFTATAVLILALGIGMATAMFTVFHAVILRPLPGQDTGRNVTL